MESRDQFLQINSPDGGFLQSDMWRTFQESVGHESVAIEENDSLYASAFVHELPVVGNYLYVPRGPVLSQTEVTEHKLDTLRNGMEMLFEEAHNKEARWIRIEPSSTEMLERIRSVCGEYEIEKAPHDVQPREILRLDLSPSEDELLSVMKQKTRYNIRLAEKKEVEVITSGEEKYRDAFVRLVREQAFRKKLTPHPEAYYRRMLEALLGHGGMLYVAVHEDDVLATILVASFGDTAVYLHGGLGEMKRECMAPYILQWRAICDAKRSGKRWYDFGGVNKEEYDAGLTEGKWHGITKFKFGFAPNAAVTQYPGSYDIVLDPSKYRLYHRLHLVRENYVYLRKFMRM